MNWIDVAMGLGAISLLLAFFSFSDSTGYKDHPPKPPPLWEDRDETDVD